MRSMLIRLVTLLLLSGMADASRLPDEFDAYLFVDGQVSVSEVGRVTEHRVDTQIEPQIKALVDRVVARWLFEPVRLGDLPVAFTSDMRVTLHGKAENGELIVRVEDVYFTDSRSMLKEGYEIDRSIRAVHIESPRFPLDAMRAGLQGRTMIALRVDRDGKVIDAAVSHTDLVGRSSSEKMLARARAPLERAALAALRQWRFELSPHAIPDGANDTSVLVPVIYSLSKSPGNLGWIEPGRWSIVTLGKKQRIDWLRDGDIAAMLGGNGTGSTLPVKLLTQPDGNAL